MQSPDFILTERVHRISKIPEIINEGIVMFGLGANNYVRSYMSTMNSLGSESVFMSISDGDVIALESIKKDFAEFLTLHAEIELLLSDLTENIVPGIYDGDIGSLSDASREDVTSMYTTLNYLLVAIVAIQDRYEKFGVIPAFIQFGINVQALLMETLYQKWYDGNKKGCKTCFSQEEMSELEDIILQIQNQAIDLWNFMQSGPYRRIARQCLYIAMKKVQDVALGIIAR